MATPPHAVTLACTPKAKAKGDAKGGGEPMPPGGKGNHHLGELNCGLLARKWRENMRALWHCLCPDLPYLHFMNLPLFKQLFFVCFFSRCRFV